MYIYVCVLVCVCVLLTCYELDVLQNYVRTITQIAGLTLDGRPLGVPEMTTAVLCTATVLPSVTSVVSLRDRLLHGLSMWSILLRKLTQV